MKLRTALAISIAVVSGSLWLFAQVKEYRLVTETVLRSPAPGDWLNWRRTDNAWGYSPLDQVKRENVGRLQLAWSWAMNEGAQEATPLVHDGIMYRPNAARCGNRPQCTPGLSGVSAKIRLRAQRTLEIKESREPPPRHPHASRRLRCAL